MEKDNYKKAWSLIDQASLKAFDKIPLEDVIPEFDRALEEGLSLLSSDEDQMVFKRAVAKSKLTSLCYRNAPIELIEKLYKDLANVGYNDIYDEFAVEACIIQCCFYNKKRSDIAYDHLMKIKGKLEKSGKEQFPEALEFIERYILKIKNQQKAV